MNIVIDIETIPTDRADIIEEIGAKQLEQLKDAIAQIKAPSNYGAEAAEKWMATKGKEQADKLTEEMTASIDEAFRKTALDGAFGRVVCVGLKHDAATMPTLIRDPDEPWLLDSLNQYLNTIHDHHGSFTTCFIGHNVVNFDLRFLMQRYIVNGIKPHESIARAAAAKPWESDKVFDTMTQWSGVGNRISLDKLCKALGVKTPKGDITGSNVWDYVKAGKLEDVAQYCSRDVMATHECWKRMTFR